MPIVTQEMKPQTLEAQGPLSTPTTTDCRVRPSQIAENESELWAIRGQRTSLLLTDLKQGNRRGCLQDNKSMGTSRKIRPLRSEEGLWEWQEWR